MNRLIRDAERLLGVKTSGIGDVLESFAQRNGLMRRPPARSNVGKYVGGALGLAGLAGVPLGAAAAYPEEFKQLLGMGGDPSAEIVEPEGLDSDIYGGGDYAQRRAEELRNRSAGIASDAQGHQDAEDHAKTETQGLRQGTNTYLSGMVLAEDMAKRRASDERGASRAARGPSTGAATATASRAGRLANHLGGSDARAQRAAEARGKYDALDLVDRTPVPDAGRRRLSDLSPEEEALFTMADERRLSDLSPEEEALFTMANESPSSWKGTSLGQQTQQALPMRLQEPMRLRGGGRPRPRRQSTKDILDGFGPPAPRGLMNIPGWD